jgi:hypothetical protein
MDRVREVKPDVLPVAAAGIPLWDILKLVLVLDEPEAPPRSARAKSDLDRGNAVEGSPVGAPRLVCETINLSMDRRRRPSPAPIRFDGAR